MKKFLPIVVFLLLLLSSNVLLGQPFPGFPDPAPVDGGLISLVAVGGLLAANKLRKRK